MDEFINNPSYRDILEFKGDSGKRVGIQILVSLRKALAVNPVLKVDILDIDKDIPKLIL